MRSSGFDPSRAVDPSARYQRSDADDAHGAVLNPVGPPICCSTTTSPPSTSTSAAANGAVTTSAYCTWTRARDGTSIGVDLASPSLGTTRTVPVTARSPGLAMTTVPSATRPSTPSGLDVAPGQ